MSHLSGYVDGTHPLGNIHILLNLHAIVNQVAEHLCRSHRICEDHAKFDGIDVVAEPDPEQAYTEHEHSSKAIQAHDKPSRQCYHDVFAPHLAVGGLLHTSEETLLVAECADDGHPAELFAKSCIDKRAQ